MYKPQREMKKFMSLLNQLDSENFKVKEQELQKLIGGTTSGLAGTSSSTGSKSGCDNTTVCCCPPSNSSETISCGTVVEALGASLSYDTTRVTESVASI
jgi:hypothetical protein